MNISELVQAAHQNAVEKGWWDEERTYGELIGLVHSEVSEVLEDYRDGHDPTEVWYEYKYEDVGSVYGQLTVLEYKNGIVKALESSVTDGWTLLGKPCGIPSELADICIRIFDIAGEYGWEDELTEDYELWSEADVSDTYTKASFPGKLTTLHYYLSQSWEAHGIRDAIDWLAATVCGCTLIAQQYGIDLNQAIAEKMAYNATRPHRHGGKVL